jgi:hypothetical protein
MKFRAYETDSSELRLAHFTNSPESTTRRASWRNHGKMVELTFEADGGSIVLTWRQWKELYCSNISDVM